MAHHRRQATPSQQYGDAERGKLIRVITMLLNLSHSCDAQTCQAAVDALHLRYSLLSREGRMELVADLITAGEQQLSAAEKRALRLFTEQLRAAPDGCGPFAGFAVDYLRHALGEQRRSGYSKTSSLPSPGVSVGRALVALSLAGILVTGCAQKKQQTASLHTGLCATPLSPRVHVAPQQYTVQPGDSVIGIARKKSVDAAELVRLNKLSYNQKRRWYNIYPGQVLVLPVRVAPEDARAEASPPESLSLSRVAHHCNSTYHLIRKGETLSGISKKYKVAIRDLIDDNNIQTPGKIKYGTLLKIAAPATPQASAGMSFAQMSTEHRVSFLEQRTIRAGHPYLRTMVETCDEFNIDPRLYAALVWEESWFDKNATSQDNCQRLVQLDPRFHSVSNDVRENFRKSLRYLKHEFTYYLKRGFDRRSAAICALAAYNGGNTRIRSFIKEGKWDGRDATTIPLQETKEYVTRVLTRCERNYHAVL